MANGCAWEEFGGEFGQDVQTCAGVDLTVPGRRKVKCRSEDAHPSAKRTTLHDCRQCLATLSYSASDFALRVKCKG
jgi:hypothetical protein